MLTRLDTGNLSHTAQFEAIYLDSFPAEERRPFQALLIDQQSGSYELFVSLNKDKVLGIATVFCPGEERFALLDYFAVHPEQRAQGMGTILFKELVELYRCKGLILCLEVEKPESTDKYDDRQRRIAFYRKGGALILQNYTYLLPDLDHSGTVTNMSLMFAGIDSSMMFSSDELLRFIEQIFTKLYQRNSNDPQLLHNLRTLPEKLILN